MPITWLVFWQAGLYAGRERRAGAGKIASSIVLVAAITLAFGWGTNYDFTTSGLIPTACVTSALAIGCLRAAYESSDARAAAAAARAAARPARRRGLSSSSSLERVLTSQRRDARLRPRRLVRAGSRRPAGSAPRAGTAGRDRAQRGRLRRGDRARTGRDGAPDGRAGADRAEDDRAPAAARRVRARPGRAALRAAAARARRRGLGGQEGVRPRRQLRRRAHRAADLAPDRGRDQARLARPGALPRPPHRRRRAGVRDAQVPDDGAGRGRAAGRPGGAERGGRGALQDPRRPAHHARRPRAPAALARRAAAGAERARAAR